MSTVTASAPGKLILFGEHAVVYDKPCIVTAVDLRIMVSVTLTNIDYIRIKTPLQSEPFAISLDSLDRKDILPQEVRFVLIALKKFQKYLGTPFGVSITTKSEFSNSYGLGSSSAVTVATLKALSNITGCKADLPMIFKMSYNTVLEAQEGIGSGADIAAAAYGGTLYYAAGGKVIESITNQKLPLVIGYSGKKASTTEYARKVKRLRNQFPELFNFILHGIENIVNDAKEALKHGDYEKAGRLMNFNQEYLHAIGVSNYELDFLISAAKLNGAYGAKLSGAGGGDCMIALASEENQTRVENAILQSGIPNAELLLIQSSAEGVRIE